MAQKYIQFLNHEHYFFMFYSIFFSNRPAQGTFEPVIFLRNRLQFKAVGALFNGH